ncbi:MULTISPECIES: hypothetical protein [unclassified Streptomyces]|uniref:hypothetical protein n=1 Tax=unclassified Streptomyces TaxID=2593676 RepID=UPI0037F87EB7
MLGSKIQRLLVTVAMAGAASILPVAAAAPAQASIIDCQNYLHYKGYRVGPKVTHACGYHVDWQFTFCVAELVHAGVRQNDAMTACNLA